MKTVLFVYVLILTAQFIAAQPDLDTWRVDHDPMNFLLHQSHSGNAISSNLDHTQLDSAKFYAWNIETSQWVFDGQLQISYKPNLELQLTLNEDLGNQYRDSILLNDDGNILIDYDQFWTGNAWTNISVFSYAYDDVGRLTELIYQSGFGGVLENQIRISYTYDNDGKLIEQLNQDWVAITWRNDLRRTYSYNEQDQLAQVVREIWNNGYSNQFRYTYSYGSNDELIEYLIEDWDGDWEISNRTTFDYDDEIRLIKEEDQDYSNGFYTGTYRTLYTYDDQDNIASITYVDKNGSAWINENRELYTYDAEGNELVYVSQEWDTTWVNVDSTYYFWNAVSATHEGWAAQQCDSGISNLVKDRLFFQQDPSRNIQSIRVYAMNGEVIKTHHGDLRSGIDVTSLPPGPYVLQVVENERPCVSVFIKI